MNKTKNVIYLAIISVTFFGVAGFASAAEYYMSPAINGGNDSNSGALTSPWATFASAFAKMKSGDTLIALDGIYNQNLGEWKWVGTVATQVSAPPNGVPSTLTEVRAANVGKAIINGSINVVQGAYIRIEGFKALDGVNIDGSNHIEIKKIGARKGIATARSSYILKEDVWAWGKDRYVISNYASHHIIDNRVIARLDDTGAIQTLPVGAISHYLTNYSVIANALLFDVSGTFQQPYSLVYSSRPDIGFNQIWGIIGFNAGPLGGIFPGDAGAGGHEIHNSVIWGVNGNGVQFNSPGPNGVYDSTIANVTAAVNGWHKINANNNIFYNTALRGEIATCDNNLFYNSTYSNVCTNSNTTTIPTIKYLPRSPMSGKGANIEKRYSISEVNGQFVVTETNENLWTWPFEDIIKNDMCAETTKGWCGTNKTLTQYVWEYIGTPIPSGIYVASPDATPPSAPTGLVIQ